MKERPTPLDMPQKLIIPLDEQGYLTDPKAHKKLCESVDCSCDSHETIGLQTIFDAGIPDPKTIFETYNKYEQVSKKVHNAYREQGHKKVWELAEEITKKGS